MYMFHTTICCSWFAWFCAAASVGTNWPCSPSLSGLMSCFPTFCFFCPLLASSSLSFSASSSSFFFPFLFFHLFLYWLVPLLDCFPILYLVLYLVLCLLVRHLFGCFLVHVLFLSPFHQLYPC